MFQRTSTVVEPVASSVPSPQPLRLQPSGMARYEESAAACPLKLFHRRTCWKPIFDVAGPPPIRECKTAVKNAKKRCLFHGTWCAKILSKSDYGYSKITRLLFLSFRFILTAMNSTNCIMTDRCCFGMGPCCGCIQLFPHQLLLCLPSLKVATLHWNCSSWPETRETCQNQMKKTQTNHVLKFARNSRAHMVWSHQKTTAPQLTLCGGASRYRKSK